MIDCNDYLKKTAVALELTEDEVAAVFDSAGRPQSKSACHGYLIGEQSKNYRRLDCELFSTWLDGLIKYLREDKNA